MRGKNISRLDRRIAAAKAAAADRAGGAESAEAAETVRSAKAAKTTKSAQTAQTAKTAKSAAAAADARKADASKAIAERAEVQNQNQNQDPDKPAKLSAREWFSVVKRTTTATHADELLDRAAALTYYGFLAVFPTLLLAVSVLGLAGTSAVDSVLNNVQKLAPGSVHNVLRTAITQVRASRGAGGTLAVAGIAGALWSASGYVGAFIRASNVVYGVRQKRPMWKTMPLRIGLTVLMMLTSMVSVVIVVFTGPLAKSTASILGLGHAALTVWSIAKWPVLVLLVGAMIILLFWAAPNARTGSRFNWITPGSTLAVVLWLILSTGFAAYVANFASYNKTYGTVAGVIVFLLWLWLSNLAILVGLEFDFELARERGNAGGPQATS